jgi:uncharacterized membrane protein
MGTALLTVLLAFVGTSGINIGQATQKFAVNTMERLRRRGIVLWIAGLLLILGSNLVLLYAVKIGRVAIIGAMAGTGLASAGIFSALVIREPIRGREILGIAMIIAAAFLIGGFSKEYTPKEINMLRLYILFGAMVGGYLTAVLVMRKRSVEGVLIGAFSGSLAGFVPLFQKVGSSAVGRSRIFFDESRYRPLAREILALFANPFALVWLAVSFLSFLTMQFAYRRGKAINIIPSFSANWILLPVIGGTICFGEELRVFQWIGVAVILAGVLVLTLKRKAPAGAHKGGMIAEKG